MSLTYHGIEWNRQKRIYDLVLGGLLLLGLVVFLGLSLLLNPFLTAETLILRGTAVAAVMLWHVILAIGPLSRLDRRFLPLLYNRRHLGVTMFLLALVHAVVALVQFHALGDVNPLVSVFTAYGQDYLAWRRTWAGVAHVPFEAFGAGALLILFLLAATSHDFWLRQLGARVWKRLHLLVYVAYALMVAHVAFGALQSERSPVLAIVLVAGFAALAGLHLLAASREARADREKNSLTSGEFVAVARPEELSEGRAKVVVVDGTRVALWRHAGRVFATGNRCRHQGGPLGEGRIRDGCITCPWHGWNYQPEDGCSPPPFEEVIPTYAVQVKDGRVWVSRIPLPARQRSEGAAIS
jgi:nitrite reductase/ring-hydroxylating ferredoxin subunit/DMSO/TMAO reductase YedYZ heme-binding membrane subunit